MTPSPPWSLVYADGSANVHRLDADDDGVTYRYEPVTPPRSSTGHYSGGAPRHERLAVDDPRVHALWRAVEALERDHAHHAAARAKGDGALTMTVAGHTRSALVVRAALGELEAVLAGLGQVAG